jgi:hypothetical protein
MINLDKKIALVLEIQALSIRITNNSEADVFCDYSGHTNGLSVRVILAGWKAENTYIDYHKIIYLDRCNEQNLEEVIKYLRLIKEEI